MKRRDFLKHLGAGAAAIAIPSWALADRHSSKKPPNIVFFFIDDLGAMDVGFMGNKFYETPNIDKLASEGMIFTDAYANGSVCAPTRACLHSGQYTPRHGVYTVWKSERKPVNKRKVIPIPNTTQLSSDNVTFMEVLKQAGYTGASMGKWHLGNDPETGPIGQGFDLNIGGTSAGAPNTYFSPYRNKHIIDGADGEYLTDRLGNEAVKFIHKNKDNPFLLYLTFFSVHTPLMAKKDDIDKYQRGKKKTHGKFNSVYAAMVASVDENIGRVLDTLDELKLADNTFVVFTSDNGGHGCITPNAPLRGGKGMFYEGGIREPMCVRWPGKVKPGTKCSVPVISIDLYPTFLEVAGVKKPDDKILDGESIVPLMTQTGSLKRDAIYWHFPAYLQRYHCMEEVWRTEPVGVIRKGDWKLMEFFEPKGTPNKIELYNLKDDIGETKNLADERPDKVKELLENMRNWRKSINAPVPTEPNPLYDPIAPPDGFDWT